MTTVSAPSKGIALRDHELSAAKAGRLALLVRVVKPQPDAMEDNGDGTWDAHDGVSGNTWETIVSPFAPVGREIFGKEEFLKGTMIAYRASFPNAKGRWWPASRMTHGDSRFHYTVTTITAKPVQQITPDEVWAAGIQRCIYRHGKKPHIAFCDDGPEGFVPDPRVAEGGRVYPPIAAFAEIFDSINGEAWDMNLWCWFIRITPKTEQK